VETDTAQKRELEDEKLSYEEVARELGVPKATLYAWVHRRQIPFIRLGKRLIRFSRKSLDQWVLARSIAPEP
jgi:excisionase family DNA binding protein